ncbi:MAG: DUF5667 domain-containing protein [Patescibacteria group bacterium]
MKYAVFIFFFSVIFFIPLSVHAEYVLPYPSVMPGNKIYKVSRVVDELKRYWSFGSIAKAKYIMNMADKYLVEAKTLFEYKQYLLAFDALNRSDNEVIKLPSFIGAGISEKKNMSLIVSSIKEQMSVHEKLLETLKNELPSVFTWTPENEISTVLFIHDRLMESIKLRQEI